MVKHGWIAALILFGCGAAPPENKPAGESIAAAVESYKQKNGRFPGRLQDLVPAHLAAIPKPASKQFVIVYAANHGGSQCWVAYQVQRDSYQEYDCLKRSWSPLAVEKTHVLGHPNAQVLTP